MSLKLAESGILTWWQLLVGAGMGMSLTQCQNAVQTVSAKEDIPIAITIINFAQFFGGTVFVSVCQGVLSNTLRTKLSRSIPGLDVTAVSSSGATDLSKLVSKNQLPLLLAAYNAAIDNVFYCALAVSCVAFGASLFVEWKTVKKQPEITSV